MITARDTTRDVHQHIGEEILFQDHDASDNPAYDHRQHLSLSAQNHYFIVQN